ncbi:tRNA-binding protein [Candidatus Woesearchaeota archaeon]|nr:tRNA-binding protein [Candidatus Woesearchaeota archaeon]
MKQTKPAPIKSEIDFKTLEKVDIRVGTIEKVIDIEKSDRLVKLVVNLKPRKIMGELSEAMIFDIGYADKITPVLAVPEKPVFDGARAG